MRHSDTDAPRPQSEQGQRPELPETLSWSEIRQPLIRSAAVITALAAAGFVGVWSARVTTPDSASIEAGFARDTATHHSQAITMSFTILAKSSSPQVQTLARSVITDEGEETGRIDGWLTDWHLSEKPDGRMPGTASPQQISDLNSLSGQAVDVHYLQLMLLHDGASVEMSQAVQGASSNRSVVEFAGTQITRDRKEMASLRSMLAQRGTSPWTAKQAGQPLPRV